MITADPAAVSDENFQVQTQEFVYSPHTEIHQIYTQKFLIPRT